MAAGSAGVGAAVLAGDLSAALADDGPAYVDAHSHIWTRDIKKFPLKKGTTVDKLNPPSFTAEELIKLAQPLGIARVVLIAHHLYYGYDNRYLIDATRRYPDVFRVVGMIDEEKPGVAKNMRSLLSQGVTGFRITPWIRPDSWLSSRGMEQMWKTAARTRQAICCLIDAKNLEEVDRMCARHPETPVVIDHFARIGVDGSIRDKDVKALCRLARHKQTHVKVSAFYALGKKQPPYLDLVPMIRRVYQAFGAERLMWASDNPYQLGGDNSYKASLDLVVDRLDFLSGDDRQWLLKKTAERVYYFS